MSAEEAGEVFLVGTDPRSSAREPLQASCSSL